jgi:hypothetical protein
MTHQEVYILSNILQGTILTIIYQHCIRKHAAFRMKKTSCQDESLKSPKGHVQPVKIWKINSTILHKVASPVKSGPYNQLMQAKVFMTSLFHWQPKTAAYPKQCQSLKPEFMIDAHKPLLKVQQENKSYASKPSIHTLTADSSV